MSRTKEGWRKVAPHLWKTPEGYSVDLQLGFKGERFRPSFDLKEDAERFIFEKKLERQQQKRFGSSALKGRIFLCQFFDLYWKAQGQRQKQAGRTEIYRIDKFKQYFGEKTLSSMTSADIEAYVQSQLDRGLDNSTVKRDLNSLRSALNFAVTDKYISVNPVAQVKKIKVDKTRVRWLNRDEITGLKAKCFVPLYGTSIQPNQWASTVDPDLADIIDVAAQTGFRKANLEQLEARHIDFIRGAVTACRTKSGEPYEVPISDELRPLLARLVASKPTGPILNTRNLDRRFRKVTTAAGLYTGEKDPFNVVLHTLRHTFASWCLQAGVPIYTVSKWMGHHSVVITESTYGHLSQNHHADEMRKVSMNISLDKISTSATSDRSNIIPVEQILDGKTECPHGESNSSFRLERGER